MRHVRATCPLRSAPYAAEITRRAVFEQAFRSDVPAVRLIALQPFQDQEATTMTELATRRPPRGQRWPMSVEAWSALGDELARLRADLPSVAGGMAEGVVDLVAFKAARRLEMLSAVFDAAERIDESQHAVIGRRVTVLEPEGEPVTYTLAFPGDGDPSRGWVSADSPLGSAVLGSLPGTTVEVAAPAGRRVVTVLAVE
jgi:transcription elongation factor GreA